ncbi:hypothetical protein ANANG_G00314820 [Anguilla anguilla]|uniref:Uncharacterized protein n=1 Tax=Anguilla anguilla TaxID=7936 RepID=A0A0E9X0Q0_ANGAN|nr:hypothetical protein ANANG_G00314820 [Anguilla anguilla]
MYICTAWMSVYVRELEIQRPRLNMIGYLHLFTCVLFSRFSGLSHRNLDQPRQSCHRFTINNIYAPYPVSTVRKKVKAKLRLQCRTKLKNE